MWDNFKIGEGETGTTARCIDTGDSKYSISQNRVSYWITDLILGLGGHIMKNTPEGEEIKEYLKFEQYVDLGTYLDTLALQNIDGEVLKMHINDFGAEKYKEGRNSLKKDLKELLF